MTQKREIVDLIDCDEKNKKMPLLFVSLKR